MLGVSWRCLQRREGGQGVSRINKNSPVSNAIQSGRARPGLKVFLDFEQDKRLLHMAITKSLVTSVRPNSGESKRQIEEG